MTRLAKFRSDKRYPQVDEGIDLEVVSEFYADGGEQRVRESLGLEDWSDSAVDKLIAHALERHPVDFERVKVVEGVHSGLAASAMRRGLRASDPKVAKGFVDTYMKHEGLLGEEKDSATMALEAMNKLLEMISDGAKRSEVATVDAAYTFPEPGVANS